MLANTTTNAVATMTTPERLTWDEICQRYPDEWVVVAEIQPVDETDETDEIDETDETDEMDGVCCVPIEDCTAVVIAHHKTRKEASPSVKEADKHYKEVGAFFTGRLIPPPYELLVP